MYDVGVMDVFWLANWSKYFFSAVFNAKYEKNMFFVHFQMFFVDFKHEITEKGKNEEKRF